MIETVDSTGATGRPPSPQARAALCLVEERACVLFGHLAGGAAKLASYDFDTSFSHPERGLIPAVGICLPCIPLEKRHASGTFGRA